MNTIFARISRCSATGVATASILVLILAMAASVIPVPAHAEYRCANPEQLTHEEKQACELARQDSPAALIQFVNRTKRIYDLYVDNYISNADVERWDRAAQAATPDSQAIASVRSKASDSPKAH
jgi:hypothetical protein